MINPQYAARKKANRNAVRRTVKTGFKAMFPRQDLATQIQRAVQLASPIQQMGHMLANFHALRMCETGQLLPTVNETFWNRCFSAVSEATVGSVPFDRDAVPDLTISADLYHQNLPPNHVQPKRPAVLKDVSFLFFHQCFAPFTDQVILSPGTYVS
jgi:hypothetical protein